MKERSIIISCFAGWHGFDLAQGLERSGHLERLITLADPRMIYDRYGIPKERIRRLPFASLLHRLELISIKYLSDSLRDWYFNVFCALYDHYTSLFISSNTSMLIAWFPFASRSLSFAKERDIVTVLDVGSTHPHTQAQLLRAEYSAIGLKPPYIPARVLKHCFLFNDVDWIFIPSTPVRDSFVTHGISKSKLVTNPYGVDTSLFSSTYAMPRVAPFTPLNPLRILLVAGLTPRKGSRSLISICHHYEYDRRITFTLVGSLDPPYCFSPLTLPSNLVIHSPMPHDQLVQLYQDNDLFFLPSIEEGFARVLIEAASCGLTLLATPSTGIGDLLHSCPNSGYMLPDNNPISAVKHIDRILNGISPLIRSHPSDLQVFSRAAYQKRAVHLLTHCHDMSHETA